MENGINYDGLACEVDGAILYHCTALKKQMGQCLISQRYYVLRSERMC